MGNQVSADALDRIFVIEKTIDCSKTNLAAAVAAPALAVEAGTFVMLTRWEVKTVEGAAGTFDMGDGTDPNGFIAAADVNALGEGVSGPVVLTEGAPNTVTGYSGGKYYAADDNIDITPTILLDAAIIDIQAVCIRLTKQASLNI